MFSSQHSGHLHLISTVLAATVTVAAATALDARLSALENSRDGYNSWDGKSNQAVNFVYIITDDQDVASASTDVMPLMNKWMAGGTNYTNFFVPITVCCPSRVGFFSGQMPHNHNITWVDPPYGGWSLACSYGQRGKYLPDWLQNVGYQTYYTGKFVNGNTLANAQNLTVPGFNQSDILLDPTTYAYYNSSFTHNGGPPTVAPGYSTERVRDFALGYIDEIAKHASKQPFFLGVAPAAPHSTIKPEDLPLDNPFTTPIYPARYDNRFPNATVFRGESWNPEVPSGASWALQLARFNATVAEYNDEWQRNRLRALQPVDEMVDAVLAKLDKHGLLDNTIIIYTGDNGFSNGQHRRPPSKTSGYEEDVRVPLLVAGKGVAKGQLDNAAYSNIDLTATIAHLAGADPDDHELDGRVMPWGSDGASQRQLGGASHHMSEYWHQFLPEGLYGNDLVVANNTYRTLRIIEDGHNWAYTVWCTGERELYNMTNDHLQMNNLLKSLNQPGSFPPLQSSASEVQRIASRLDAVVVALRRCKGRECRFAWKKLFPYGDATSLDDALKEEFDAYFDRLPKTFYTRCELGFHSGIEGPEWSSNLAYWRETDAPGSDFNKRALESWEQTLVD